MESIEQEAMRAGLVEVLAALSHEQWAGWARWMFEKWNQVSLSGETFQARWRRQMETPYADLSNQEKELDRIEARRIIQALSVRKLPDGITLDAVEILHQVRVEVTLRNVPQMKARLWLGKRLLALAEVLCGFDVEVAIPGMN